MERPLCFVRDDGATPKARLTIEQPQMPRVCNEVVVYMPAELETRLREDILVSVVLFHSISKHEARHMSAFVHTWQKAFRIRSHGRHWRHCKTYVDYTTEECAQAFAVWYNAILKLGGVALSVKS